MCNAAQLAANEHKGLIKSTMPFTFQLIVGSKQVQQRKPQQDLADYSLTKVISIVKLDTTIFASQTMAYLTLNKFSNNALSFSDKYSTIFKLVVASVTNEYSKGSSFTQLPIPNNNLISSFKSFVELVSEGASQPFNQAPVFTAKLIVELTFKQSNQTLFGNSHSQLVVYFCDQSLANKQDIKAGLNLIRYLRSILWQMSEMYSTSQMVANFRHRAPFHFNNDCLHRLIVNSVSEGAQFAPNITASIKAALTFSTLNQSLLLHPTIPKHSFTSAKNWEYFVREIGEMLTMRTILKTIKLLCGRSWTHHHWSRWHLPLWHWPSWHWPCWLHWHCWHWSCWHLPFWHWSTLASLAPWTLSASLASVA